MQATLIRFGPDLFQELKEEARRNGVSVAQYVREAVVARMAYTAGLRGDPRYGLDGAPSAPDGSVRSAAARIRAEAERVRAESQAVHAESEQTLGQARRLAQRRPSSRKPG